MAHVNLDELLSGCIDAAERAAVVIVAVNGMRDEKGLGIADKAGAEEDGEDFQTVADRTAEAIIITCLQNGFPGIRLIGEETESAGLDLRAALDSSPVELDLRPLDRKRVAQGLSNRESPTAHSSTVAVYIDPLVPNTWKIFIVYKDLLP